MFRLTPVVKILLIINVVVFFAPFLIRGLEGFIHQNFALFYIEGDYFRPWQIFTYMFLHANGGHILGNMFGLIVFGPWLEDLLDSKRFLAYYIIVGVGAGILFMGTQYLEVSNIKAAVNGFLQDPKPEEFDVLISEHFPQHYYTTIGVAEQYNKNPDNEKAKSIAVDTVYQMYHREMNGSMLGASGAVFGLILAVGLLFPERRIMLLIPPIPLKVRTFAIFYGAYEVYSLIKQNPNDNIAHFAHLGGMLVGYLLLVSWGEARNRYQ